MVKFRNIKTSTFNPHAWQSSIQNHAVLNSQEIEEFDMSIFQAMFDDDAWAAEFDDELDTIDLF